jgi:hypothetical protein
MKEPDSSSARNMVAFTPMPTYRTVLTTALQYSSLANSWT